MKRKARTITFTSFTFIVVLAAGWPAQAEDVKTPYPNMAPLDQYLMEREAEITLARSAAPDSISHDAEVMILGQHGYETAVKGTNGFVCLVERSWASPVDDPGFWNPKLRAPNCFNPVAARSYLPLTVRKTKLILATRSKAEMVKDIKAAVDSKELLPPEMGAMVYMMSKQGYLNDEAGHWHPHLMFILPPTDPATWGVGLPGAPVLSLSEDLGRMTVFLVPVAKWSDGTAWSKDEHEH
jgi:hypothetical protein